MLHYPGLRSKATYATQQNVQVEQASLILHQQMWKMCIQPSTNDNTMINW